MRDNVIPFAEASARVRRNRGAGLSTSDAGWLLLICFWPASLSVFAGLAAMDAFCGRGGRR